MAKITKGVMRKVKTSPASSPLLQIPFHTFSLIKKVKRKRKKWSEGGWVKRRKARSHGWDGLWKKIMIFLSRSWHRFRAHQKHFFWQRRLGCGIVNPTQTLREQSHLTSFDGVGAFFFYLPPIFPHFNWCQEAGPWLLLTPLCFFLGGGGEEAIRR